MSKVITIGRADDSDIVVAKKYETVSNKHAEIEISPEGRIAFIDHSTNGSSVNGVPVSDAKVVVNFGDNIVLADVYQLDWDAIKPHLPAALVAPVAPVTPEAPQPSKPQRNPRMTEQFVPGAHLDKPVTRGTERFDPTNIPAPAAKDNQQTEPADKPTATSERHYSQTEIEQYTARWNWGAFFGTWAWGLFNGCYWPLLLLLVCWVPYLGQIVQICMSVNLGLTGSHRAWRSGRFGSFDSFVRSQKRWRIIGLIVFLASLVGYYFMLDFMLNLF